MSTDSEPNTKYLTVRVPVPRDPQAYRGTVHFGQRARDRLPDEDRADIIEETIRQGHCYESTPTDSVEDEDVTRTFAFERAIDGTVYRVVVGIKQHLLRPQNDSNGKHLALSVMEVVE